MPLRLVFMGTPAFSVPTLAALAGVGHDLAAVYTQPPRPAGRRGLELVPSPVQREAERLGLPVRLPRSLKDETAQAGLVALKADAAVVVAYGLLLSQAVLDAPRLGCWNGHASALPRWRGAAPIQRAIMAGDKETAMVVMRMEAGLDTGPVALTERLAISPEETAGDLYGRLAEASARLMVEAMARLEAGTLETVPQAVDGVTYAAKIAKDETRIDWTMPASAVHDHARGLSPAPGAWSELTDGGRTERVKLLRTMPAEGRGVPGSLVGGEPVVACGEGALRLAEVQRAGGRPVSGADLLRGLKAPHEARFT